MSKFTKGPWYLIETAPLKKGGATTLLLCNKTPNAHGVLYGVGDADAYLIQVAPELLEALERVAEILSHPEVLEKTEDFVAPKYGKNVLQHVETLINKAKGGI